MTHSLLVAVTVVTGLQLLDINIFMLCQPVEQLLIANLTKQIYLGAITGREQRNLIAI